jgi:hypothetical protein
MQSAGDNETPAADLRTLKEVYLKLLTTYLFGIISYSHYGSLLSVPAELHFFQVLQFCCNPGYVVGQLVLGLFSTIARAVEERRNIRQRIDISFWISAGLFVQATKPGTPHSVMLLRTPYACVERVTATRSLKFFGRILAILVAITQATGTVYLFVRRIQLAPAYEDEYARYHGYHHDPIQYFDFLTGLMGIASLATNISCLVLVLLNVSWQISDGCEHDVSHDVADTPEGTPQTMHVTNASPAEDANMKYFMDLGVKAAYIGAVLGLQYRSFLGLIINIFLFLPLDMVPRAVAVVPVIVLVLFGGSILRGIRRLAKTPLLKRVRVFWRSAHFAIIGYFLLYDSIMGLVINGSGDGGWKDPMADGILSI